MRRSREGARLKVFAAIAGSAWCAISLAGDVDCAADASSAESRQQCALDWLDANAVPLSGLTGADERNAMRRIVGAAEVVAFGEANHNAHEFLTFRNELFRFLAEELGFTAIAAETDYVRALDVDDYVAGVGGPVEPPAHAVLSWAYGSFRENRELVEWMRTHNARPGTQRKLRFYGLEASGNLDHDGRGILAYVLAYLRQADPSSAGEFEERFAAWRGSFTLAGYRALAPRLQDAVVVDLQDAITRFERWHIPWRERTSKQAYDRAYRAAVTARQLAASLRIGGDGRDLASFDNLRWVLEQEGPQGRVLVFMHNMHVSRWRKFAPPAHPLHSPLGEHADDLLARRMVVIGSAHDGGRARNWLDLPGFDNCERALGVSRPGSLNALLARAGHSSYLIDFRGPAGPAAEWFREEHASRNINIVDGYSVVKPSVSFDALVFFRDISPLVPLGEVSRPASIRPPRAPCSCRTAVHCRNPGGRAS